MGGTEVQTETGDLRPGGQSQLRDVTPPERRPAVPEFGIVDKSWMLFFKVR